MSDGRKGVVLKVGGKHVTWLDVSLCGRGGTVKSMAKEVRPTTLEDSEVPLMPTSEHDILQSWVDGAVDLDVTVVAKEGRSRRRTLGNVFADGDGVERRQLRVVDLGRGQWELFCTCCDETCGIMEEARQLVSGAKRHCGQRRSERRSLVHLRRLAANLGCDRLDYFDDAKTSPFIKAEIIGAIHQDNVVSEGKKRPREATDFFRGDSSSSSNVFSKISKNDDKSAKSSPSATTKSKSRKHASPSSSEGKKKLKPKREKPPPPPPEKVPTLSSVERRRALVPEFGGLDEGLYERPATPPKVVSSESYSDDDDDDEGGAPPLTEEEEEEEGATPRRTPASKKKTPRRAISSRLYQFTRLKDIHPELVPEGYVSARTFPRYRAVFMPSFELETASGGARVRNEKHEAYEQFVVAWIFSEILPRYCLRHLDGKTAPENFEWRRVRRLRVLELGGGIGAVSTMIQQSLEALDPTRGTHVVFEPNADIAEGPLLRNKLFHRSTFSVLNGVLSKLEEVPMYAGNVDAKNPRAWMWNTVRREGVKASSSAAGYDLDHVKSLLGGPPNILIADCEGGFPPVIADFPEILDHLCVLYYERDPGDYDDVERLLDAKGFKPVLKANLHRCYVNEAAFEASDDPNAVDELVLFNDDNDDNDDAQRSEDARRSDDDAQDDDAQDDDDDDDDQRKKTKALLEEDARVAKLTASVAAEALAIAALETTKANVEAFASALEDRDVARAVRSGVEAAQRKIDAKEAKVAAWRAAVDRGDDRPVGSLSNAASGRRRLSAVSRVACRFDNGSWYTGCITYAPGDTIVLKNSKITDPDNHYAVYFDDDDQAFDVPRTELRAVYIKNSFDWASPWIDDDHPPPPAAAAAETKTTDDDDGGPDDDDDA